MHIGLRGRLAVSATLAVLAAGVVVVFPGAASARELPGGWQDAERFGDTNGVGRGFVLDHESPVGRRDGVCSGTLIGDGLYLTAGQCISGNEVNNHVRFGAQLDWYEAVRPQDNYNVAQVLENHPERETLGFNDHGLLRLVGNPENEYGFATMDAAEPDVAKPLVVIGHPNLPNADGSGETSWKTAAVPNIACLAGGEEGAAEELTFSGISLYRGLAGAGVWNPATGRLAGVTRAFGTRCGGSGYANTILRHQRVSDFLDTDHGSARMYSYTGAGLTTWNWTRKDVRSSWHHIVPGNYRGLATQELFFYDSRSGEGQFGTVTARGITPLGPVHTGLSRPSYPWGQIVPVQLDTTPQQELMFLNTRLGLYRFYRTNGSGTLEPLPVGPPTGPSGSPNNYVRGTDGTPPRLAVTGNFASRAGQEIAFHFPLEGRVEIWGVDSSGWLIRLSTVASNVPAASVMLAGEFSTASALQEVLLYHPKTEQISAVYFRPDRTTGIVGPVRLPGGMATQLSTGTFNNGTANLMAYQPSASNVYSNVAENTGTVNYFRLGNNLALRSVLAEGGHRRSISKFIIGDFITDNQSNAIMYDRYRE